MLSAGYSNFYGGAVVNSKDYDEVVQILNERKDSLNLYKEVKSHSTNNINSIVHDHNSVLRPLYEMEKQGE